MLRNSQYIHVPTLTIFSLKKLFSQVGEMMFHVILFTQMCENLRKSGNTNTNVRKKSRHKRKKKKTKTQKSALLRQKLMSEI